jgi:hypothetical protein
VEVYIDDIVLKLVPFDSHQANFLKAFDKMRQCGLKMSPHKCDLGVSASKFLGFIIHEHGIDVDPNRIRAIQNVGAPTCKHEMQRFLSKVNYLRRFISNLAKKVSAFTPILWLKIMLTSLGGQNSSKHSTLSNVGHLFSNVVNQEQGNTIVKY